MKVVTKEEYERLFGQEGKGQTTSEDQDEKISAIIKNVGEKQKAKGRQILSALSTTISWEKTGQLVVDGTTVPNSNILDLLLLSMKPFPVKRWKLPGLDEFLFALEKANVPRHLISTQVLDLISQRNKKTSDQPAQCLKWIKFEDYF